MQDADPTRRQGLTRQAIVERALEIGDAEGLERAPPLSRSTGTETWSCAMNQLPSIFRKHVVARTQKSVLLPFFNVPLIRLTLWPNATPSLKAIRLCSHVLQRRHDVE